MEDVRDPSLLLVRALSTIRSFDRLQTGGRVLVLVALGFLAYSMEKSEDWASIRNTAAHADSLNNVSDRLLYTSHNIEEFAPELRGVFVGVLTEDVLQAKSHLRTNILLAGSVLEALKEKHFQDFGAWFDTMLDEVAHGPSTGEISTPRPLANLMVELAQLQPEQTVWDPSSGYGGLLAAAAAKGASLFGQELNAISRALAQLRLFLLGTNADVRLGDTLWYPADYDAVPSGFDRVLCDPPTGTISTKLQYLSTQAAPATRRLDTLFLQQCLEQLRPSGRAVVLMSFGFLSRKGPEESIRRRLVEQKRLEGVISLPSGTIPWTDVPRAILVINSARSEWGGEVKMLDAQFIKERGSRNSQVLDQPRVDELLTLYEEMTDVRNAVRVPHSRLLSQNLDLRPQSYVHGEAHDQVSIKELWQQLTEAEAVASEAAEKINRIYTELRLKL